MALFGAREKSTQPLWFQSSSNPITYTRLAGVLVTYERVACASQTAMGGHCSVNGTSTGKPSAQPLPPEIPGECPRTFLEQRHRSSEREADLRAGPWLNSGTGGGLPRQAPLRQDGASNAKASLRSAAYHPRRLGLSQTRGAALLCSPLQEKPRPAAAPPLLHAW